MHNHFLTHKLLCSPRENESTAFNNSNHNRRNSGNRNPVIHFHIFFHISAYFHTFPPRYLLFSYTCVNKFTQKIHFYVIQQWRHPFQDDFPTEYVAKKKIRIRKESHEKKSSSWRWRSTNSMKCILQQRTSFVPTAGHQASKGSSDARLLSLRDYMCVRITNVAMAVVSWYGKKA